MLHQPVPVYLFFIVCGIGWGGSCTIPEACDLGDAGTKVPAYKNTIDCNCNGVAHYENGTYTGLQWQCVEYVRRYYLNRLGIDLASLWSASGSETRNADEWYDHYDKMRLARFPNGGSMPPLPGDILVSDGKGVRNDGTGHVAIVTVLRLPDLGNTTSEVLTIQQNFTTDASEVNRSLAIQVAGSTYKVADFGTDYPIQGWLRDCTGGITTAAALPHGYMHPVGTLVTSPSSDGTVYVLRPDAADEIGIGRYGIASEDTLHELYNQPWLDYEFDRKDIITIPDEEMLLYPNLGTLSSLKAFQGNGRSSPDGRLIVKPGGKEVGIVSDGKLRKFACSEAFQHLGYRTCNIYNDSKFDLYPLGPNIDYNCPSALKPPSSVTATAK